MGRSDSAPTFVFRGPTGPLSEAGAPVPPVVVEYVWLRLLRIPHVLRSFDKPSVAGTETGHYDACGI